MTQVLSHVRKKDVCGSATYVGSGTVGGGKFHGAERIMEYRQKKIMLEEDGDLLREYQAMHEENFLINWLQEDMGGEIG